MIVLIAIAFAGAVGLGIVTLSSSVQQRATSRRALQALDGYQISETVREQEMLANIGSRLLAPLGEAATKLVRRFTPVGYMEGLARKTVLAGSPAGYEVDRLLVIKVLGAASGIVWIPLVYKGLAFHG